MRPAGQQSWLSSAQRACAGWANRAIARRLGGPCEVCRLWGSDPICHLCTAQYSGSPTRCLRCAMPQTGAPVCGECLRTPPPFERAVVGLDYGFPWDLLITEFKFGGRTELAAPLAGRLFGALSCQAAPAVDLILPVPLAPARLAERGFNQAWLLARQLAGALQRPADAQLLQRPIATAHQAGLPRAERDKNLRGAFMVDPRRRDRLQGRRVALVDDVMTTGATLREASSELRRAGASAVEVWAVARTV